MRMMNLKCPNCGSNLDVEQDRDNIYCQYCGALVYSKLDSHVVEEHVTRDDTEIKRIEHERYIYDQERERNEKNKKMNLIILVSAIITMGISLMLPQSASSIGGALLIISIILFVVYFKYRKHS